uniref:Uncharacterized protein LOC114346646 n=1 Tax=Diabrotica virgifera virgifera TaxID=50390 RepID=A0A6P7H3T2_DIAVI
RKEKKIHRRKKREHIEKELQEIEELNKPTETRKFYQKFNKSRKEFKPRTMMCRDKEGDIVTQQSEILQRWTELFKEKFEQNGDPLYDEIILDQTDTRETTPPPL